MTQAARPNDGPADEAQRGWYFQKSKRSQDLEETVDIIDALFGCWHRNTTFPLTSKREHRHSEAASQTGTYVVCLDCGKEFAYDWKKMRVLGSGTQRSYANVHAQLEAKAR